MRKETHQKITELMVHYFARNGVSDMVSAALLIIFLSLTPSGLKIWESDPVMGAIVALSGFLLLPLSIIHRGVADLKRLNTDRDYPLTFKIVIGTGTAAGTTAALVNYLIYFVI